MASKRDPRSEDVGRLHHAYADGRLNVFVGAGISQQSGFPGWDELNQWLVLRYLNEEIGASTPAAMLAAEHIIENANTLYDAFEGTLPPILWQRACEAILALCWRRLLTRAENSKIFP